MKRTNISCEFFPPKTPQGLHKLRETWHQLAAIKPHFYSVTFGAGGSTQAKTAEVVSSIQQEKQIPVAPHITCIGSTKKSIMTMLEDYLQQGITHLVVLRGDAPSGSGLCSYDFTHAYQLVEFIRKQFADHFYINVAAYPEFHPQARSAKEDIIHFKNKVLAGANSAITQYFFNADAYFYFKDECAAKGVTIPIIPGIMPVQNFAGLQRFSQLCGAEIPRWLLKRLQDFIDDNKAVDALCTEVVTSMCSRLLTAGAPGLHFYTLNKINPSKKIINDLFQEKSVTPAVAIES